MTLLKRITTLHQLMGDQKHYLDNNFYRVRQENASTYKIASLKADSCGASLYNPQFTIKLTGQVKEPITIDLYNNYQTPIETLSYSKENATQLEAKLTELIAEIEKAYKKTYS